jgi:hypothetical protein
MENYLNGNEVVRGEDEAQKNKTMARGHRSREEGHGVGAEKAKG